MGVGSCESAGDKGAGKDLDMVVKALIIPIDCKMSLCLYPVQYAA